MKLHFNGFWNDDSLDFFVVLLQNVFRCPISVGSFEESDILFESVFGLETRLYAKTWKYTFFFSGESDRRMPETMGFPVDTLRHYSCVLKGEPNNGNRINLPLFVYYSYYYGFLDRFVYHGHDYGRPIGAPRIQRVPEKNICAIVTNSHSQEGRIDFLDALDRVVPIDFAGNYRNNVPRITHRFCTPEFIAEVAKYKFIVAMENSRNHTYITEKILHAMAANTIPIYWGSEHIEMYFNPERFIHVKSFDEESVQSAIRRIVELLNDEAKYLAMVNQPIYTNNRIPLTIRSVAKDVRQLLSIPDPQKVHFISFGGPSANYHSAVKTVCGHAEKFGAFSTVRGYTEEVLKADAAFWYRNGKFIEANPRLYGYAIWKPYIILRRLFEIEDGDILVYSDAGNTINLEGNARFQEYLDMLNATESGILTFQLEHMERRYTKRATYAHFGQSPETDDSLQRMTGLIMLKKNTNSMDFVCKWQDAMQHHGIINDDRSDNEYPDFIDHRHDQSVFSLLSKTHNAIELKDETYFAPDWGVGRMYPFWATRNRQG